MANVLALDCTSGGGFVEVDVGSTPTDVWVEFDVAFNAAVITSFLALGSGTSKDISGATASGGGGDVQAFIEHSGGVLKWKIGSATAFTPASPITSMQFYHVKQHLQTPGGGSPGTFQMWVDGVSIGTDTTSFCDDFEFYDLFEQIVSAGGVIYYDNFTIGTTEGASDLGSDDFESGTLAFWNSFVADASVVADPGITPAGGGGGGGGGVTAKRVGIAFTDGPREPDPTWTWIDQTDNLVARIETHSGKQTNRDTTDTGTATVYLNDTTGDFDPLNASSPYFGNLDGKQILIQIFNPVDQTWYPRWRGTIDDYGYSIFPVLGPDGKPIVANIQIDCVDIFDYLGGYELTPGLDGDTPPAGAEGTVFYEDTAGTVDDRIIQVLTDALVDSASYVVFTGNVSVQETSYEPGTAALSALRDAADAEAPTIANIYCDRFGRFVFHGFYSRADPDAVAATTTTDVWDFQRWKLGDGTTQVSTSSFSVAISGFPSDGDPLTAVVTTDTNTAQIRVLGYSRARSDVINAAVAWPKGMDQKDMPNQVFIDSTSITDLGRHSLAPMSDLIVKEGVTSGFDLKTQCAKYAELIVKNQKDPTERITAIQLKSLPPADPRAANVWNVICRADISDIANVTVGYPAGTGIQNKDNYIEGVSCVIQPLQPIQSGGFDYVEIEFDLTPAEWTQDTHGVFPAFL